MAKRICSKCGIEKDLSKFGLRTNSSDGMSRVCKACCYKYHKKYCEQHAEKNNEKRKEYNKKHRKENPDIYKIIIQRRSAKKKQLPHTLTVKQWVKCKEHFDNKCAYCGESKKLTIDHFIPLSKGGGLTIENVIPSCQKCNSSKGTKSFYEWYPKQKHYNEVREFKIITYLSL